MDKQEKTLESDIMKRCFRKIYEVLWYYFNVIILTALAASATAFIIGKFMITPTYESVAKIAVWVNEGEKEVLSEEELRLNTQLTGDFVELVSSRNVVEQVIESFQLGTSYEKYMKKLTVVSSEENHIVSVIVRDTDSELAKQMLDEICVIAAEEIKEIVAMDVVHVIDEGLVAENPVAPDVGMWTLTGLLLGGFVSAVIIVVRDFLDETIRSSEDIEKYLQLDTLTIIPFSETESRENGDGEEV
ncbi:MAG: hypothetical protein IJ324_09925 [Lachnospiraceae bacterium]|nr:hypothetical protein [Lachnospiraceae bacterium]